MRTAVIFHGFPNPLFEGKSPLLDYLKSHNYEIYMPYLLSNDYKFNPIHVVEEISSHLRGRKPDVIIGISVGGIFAPYLASRFPDAKLILFNTGSHIETGVRLYNKAINIIKNDKNLKLIKILRKTPKWLFRLLYSATNFREIRNKNVNLYKRADEAYNTAFSIPLSKLHEILEFLNNDDNSSILKIINNRTIIVSSKVDNIMPLKNGESINNLIKNSKLIINERLHYDYYVEEDCKILDDFLTN